ncbi:hypothetical protein BpHYR1_036505 [Brachionus plicatilis]|uniref:Uncharacterized protein n=1 Tax=Brachionus plicatilis TaxID=10195 RepID=A0A3M7RNR6_BRAPC|nr:hypothetical protein BpHYR1_036505 [Brachionus plicatilis]
MIFKKRNLVVNRVFVLTWCEFQIDFLDEHYQSKGRLGSLCLAISINQVSNFLGSFSFCYLKSLLEIERLETKKDTQIKIWISDLWAVNKTRQLAKNLPAKISIVLNTGLPRMACFSSEKQ